MSFVQKYSGAADASKARFDTTGQYVGHGFWLRQSYASIIGMAHRPAQEVIDAGDAYLQNRGEAALPGLLGGIAQPSAALRAVHDAVLDMTLSLSRQASAAHPALVKTEDAPHRLPEQPSRGQEIAYANLKRMGAGIAHTLQEAVAPNLAEALVQLNDYQRTTLQGMVHRLGIVATNLTALQEQEKGGMAAAV